jgi:hypothetical protein
MRGKQNLYIYIYIQLINLKSYMYNLCNKTYTYNLFKNKVIYIIYTTKAKLIHIIFVTTSLYT